MKIAFRTGLIFLAAFLSQPAGAGQTGQAHTAPSSSASPYAGMEGHAIKALSDQQIADLRSGRGMGLALVAELNGYPGPSHVLELSDALQLTDEQRVRTRHLVDAMKEEAIPLGERIIADEAELDRLFAGRSITPEALKAATARISTEEGALRAAHLRYHIEMVQVLVPNQIRRYAELRGYGRAHQHN